MMTIDPDDDHPEAVILPQYSRRPRPIAAEPDAQQHRRIPADVMEWSRQPYDGAGSSGPRAFFTSSNED